MSSTARFVLGLILASLCFVSFADAAPDTTASARQKISVTGEPVSPQVLANALGTVNLFLDASRAGRNAPGYDLLTPESRKKETPAQWNQLFNQLAAKAGDRKRTQFAFALQTDHLPDAKKGSYVVVGLKSTFAKTTLAETIILSKVASRYLIAGYHFQSVSNDGSH